MSDPDRVSRRDLFRARFGRGARGPRAAPGRAPGPPWAPLPAGIAEVLVEAAGVAAWESLLEVGPGDGAVARAGVARNAFAVVAGSVPAAVEHGRTRAVLEAHEAPGDELPFAPGEFDRAIAPFGAGEAALAELARVVRPGGTLLVAGWAPAGVIGQVAAPRGLDWGDPERVRAALGAACSEIASQEHETQVAVADALALAVAAGASREAAEERLVETGNGPRIALAYVVTTGRRPEV